MSARPTRPHRTAPSYLLPIVAFSALVGLGVTGCSDDDDGYYGGPVEQDTGERNGSPDAVDDNDVDDNDADDAGGEDADATVSYDFDLEGLSAPVTVRYDEWGVLHLECEKTRDCFIAQGYFHADDRFFEMDLIRRQTLGELSTLVGLTFGLSRDKKFRQLMTTRKGEPLEDAYLEKMNDSTRSMLDAYSAGVNAWLDDMRNGENGASLSEIYGLDIINEKDIPDWKPQHSVALYLQLAYQLSLSTDGDLFRGEMLTKLDPKVASDLFTVKPGLVSNTFEAAGVQMAQSLSADGLKPTKPEQFARLKERLQPASRAIAEARDKLQSAPSLLFGPRTRNDGSNNWAVGPDQAADEAALLANDPHLTLDNPTIWYFVEIHSESSEGREGDGLHVAGASVPSVPGIVVGQNEEIAWGVTTARLDLADAYQEKLTSNGEAVERNGETIELIEKDYTFEGLNDKSKTVTFEWVPGHGPVVSKDKEEGTAISIKWVAHEAGADFNFLLPLMRSESVDEAMEAVRPIRSINQNWLFADADGSIGWYPRGAIPKRPWASTQTPNWLPLPGEGGAEWQGTVSHENAPKIQDPPNDLIATANNDFDGSYTDGDATNDGHTPWQEPPAPGNRHKRIVELIEADSGSHTVETMHQIQADTRSLQGETLVPHILDAVDESNANLSADAQKVVTALRDWNYECPTGLDGTDPKEASKVSGSEAAASIGCSAFHVLLPQLTDEVFGDELDSLRNVSGLSDWSRLQAALLYLFDEPSELANGTDYFDDTTTENTEETEGEIVAAALETTATRLEQAFESNASDDWRWGRIHTVTFTNLLKNSFASDWNDGPYANDGGWATVDVANPLGTRGNYNHVHGPSLRVVFRASDEGVEGWFQLPGGQVFDRESDYYGSLVDEWLANERQKLLFESEEVEQGADRTIRIAPTDE